MPSFAQASNFTIHNLTQTENNASHFDAFKLLQEHMVPGATHNSGERYDAPKCHPETRKAVISNIKSWVDSNADVTKMMWLHGPAGAGKSAIAQTTADNCYKEKKLAASFFFSRLAGRNKKDGLIATIAYQLCLSIPATKEHIIKCIEEDPNIFKSNLLTQMQSLVVEPLNSVFQEVEGAVLPRLIIIDGLDECEKKNDQAEIIEAVAQSVSIDSGSNFCVLLVSRPELDIRQAFNKDEISPICTRLALDDSFDPDEDIDLYLRSHFEALKRQHVMGSILPVMWPSDEAIGQIVKKSSGQFIYASTIIKYISDPRRDPIKRLNTVLEIHPTNGDKPYSQLDTLYSSILSVCEDYNKVALIFEAIMFMFGKKILMSVEYLELFIALEGEVLLLLADLHTIVDVNNLNKPGGSLRFYHASLYDFLVDSTRSHEFFIDEHNAHARMSVFCLDMVENHASAGFPHDVSNYSWNNCFFHYQCSGLDDRVWKYILKKDILKIYHNIHPSKTAGLGFEVRSMLGVFIFRNYFEDIKVEIRDVIYTEFQNRLMLYPRQEFIVVLHQLANTSMTLKPALKLHKDYISETTFDVRDDGIFDDLFVNNNNVIAWFENLMETTQYVHQLPENIRGRAILELLDVCAASKDIGIKCLERIFENIPLPSTVVDAVLEKWENIKTKSHLKVSTTNEIDEYIRSNCHRSVQLNQGTKTNDRNNMLTPGSIPLDLPAGQDNSATDADLLAEGTHPQCSNTVKENLDARTRDKKKKNDRFEWCRCM